MTYQLRQVGMASKVLNNMNEYVNNSRMPARYTQPNQEASRLQSKCLPPELSYLYGSGRISTSNPVSSVMHSCFQGAVHRQDIAYPCDRIPIIESTTTTFQGLPTYLGFEQNKRERTKKKEKGRGIKIQERNNGKNS